GSADGRPRTSGSGRSTEGPRPSRADRGDRGGPGARAGAGGRREGRQGGAGRGFGPFKGGQRQAHAGPGGSRDRKRVDDEEARRVRSAAEEAVARASGDGPSLRVV